MIDFNIDVLPLRNKLYRLALNITQDVQTAKDVVQETMIKVWEKREKIQDNEAIEDYCLTTCRNYALDVIKNKNNQNIRLEDDAFRIADTRSQNPLQQTDLQHKINLIKKLYDALPEKQRSIIHLREIEGKSYKEISVILGISEEQTKVTLFRARQAIKQQFEKLDHYGL
ncbi:MAG: sigma-70 family RNA polymerase sigma factor [Prevotellaceae bacterium]|nr:sigma-70 family RNA polymerase sigma factor [Candidatus Faecinaster equi]